MPPSELPWQLFLRKDKLMRHMLDCIAVVTQPTIICDIGSFNGEEIVRFHGLVPSAKCFCFEANPDNISRYIRPRGDLDKICISELAISDHDGITAFNILHSDGEDDWRRGAGSLHERTDGLGEPSRKIDVGCMRLDTYFETMLDETFLLWIDVEGALDKVIRGAEKVLRRTIALRAEIEQQQHWKGQKLSGEIIKMIEEAGFILLGDSHTKDTIQQSDVLFLHRGWLDLAVHKNCV